MFVDGQDADSNSSNGLWVDLSAPLSHLPVHLRGGCTIPMCSGKDLLTTEQVRTSPIDLHIAISPQGFSTGTFFPDDGSSQENETAVKDDFISLYFDSKLYDSQLLVVKVDGHFGMKGGVKIKALQIFSSSSFEPRHVFVQKNPIDCTFERLSENLIAIYFDQLSLEKSAFFIIH